MENVTLIDETNQVKMPRDDVLIDNCLGLTKISLRIDVKQLQLLQEISEQQGKIVNAVVRDALDHYTSRYSFLPNKMRLWLIKRGF